MPINKWEFNYECGNWVLYRNGEPYEWFADILPTDVTEARRACVDAMIDSMIYIQSRIGLYWEND